jgi:hypothetical protein
MGAKHLELSNSSVRHLDDVGLTEKAI